MQCIICIQLILYIPGLKFVQLQKNQSLHAGIKCTPFKAVCGSDPQIKLESNIIPVDLKPLLFVASSTIRSLSNDSGEESEEFESAEDLGSDNNAPETVVNISRNRVELPNQHFLEDSNVQPKARPRRKRKFLETSSESGSEEDEIIPKTYLTRRKKLAMENIGDRELAEGSDNFSDYGQLNDHLFDKEEPENHSEEREAFVNLSSTEDGSHIVAQTILCCVCNLECSGYHMCAICDQFAHATCGETQGDEGCGSMVICRRCELRNEIKENTFKQAKKMLKRSNQKFCDVSTHDNVVIPIPAVDRAKCDFPNLVGIILEKHDDQYIIGCRVGWIKETFARNGFEKCSSNFLTPEDIPKTVITLRSAATLASVDGKGQGMFKCNCKKSCLVGRCKCKKANLLCNSKCHGSGSCDNNKNHL